jgi:Domain of unknown function (DUF4136)
VQWIQRYRIGHSIAFISGSCSLAATVAGDKQRGTLSTLLLLNTIPVLTAAELLSESRGGEVMKMQKVMLALVGVTLVFAGMASAQQVKTDYDRSANFALYKTYSWEHVETKDPLNVDRLKHAVNAVLATRGWTPVDAGADVAVVAMEITRDQQTLNTFYDGFGGGWGWRRFGGGGFGEATTTTDTYKVGTVVVDLFDTKTKQLIWRGAASDTLSDNSDKNIKNLNESVDKMFKHFPPGATTK